MRTTFPRLLLLIAVVVVIFVELRTVLAFFGIDVSVLAVAVAGIVVIAALLLWAVFPTSSDPKTE